MKCLLMSNDEMSVEILHSKRMTIVKMLKLGIEPKTFALLARRSNQLSYSSTGLRFLPTPFVRLTFHYCSIVTHSKHMLLGTDSSFDDDDDKYQKTWIRNTRVKVVVGLVVICLFVFAIRYFPSVTYLFSFHVLSSSQSTNAEPHLRTKVTTIDNHSG